MQRVRAGGASSRTARRRTSTRRSRGCGRSPRRPASSCCRRRAQAAERRTSPSPRRRRHDAPRAHAVPRHRRAGDRRQLRPGRLPDRDPRRRARERASRASSPASTRCSRCRRSRCRSTGERHAAVNDAVIVSGTPGRIVEIDYSIGGEDLGTQPCDGLLCATPPGSTAYNLSNGGPVLVWGLDAAVITFVAPHTLHARPLVVGPDFELVVVNRTPDVEAVVLVDGTRSCSLAPGDDGHGAVRDEPDAARDAARADVLRPLRQVFGID